MRVLVMSKNKILFYYVKHSYSKLSKSKKRRFNIKCSDASRFQYSFRRRAITTFERRLGRRQKLIKNLRAKVDTKDDSSNHQETRIAGDFEAFQGENEDLRANPATPTRKRNTWRTAAQAQLLPDGASNLNAAGGYEWTVNEGLVRDSERTDDGGSSIGNKRVYDGGAAGGTKRIKEEGAAREGDEGDCACLAYESNIAPADDSYVAYVAADAIYALELVKKRKKKKMMKKKMTKKKKKKTKKKKKKKEKKIPKL